MMSQWLLKGPAIVGGQRDVGVNVNNVTVPSISFAASRGLQAQTLIEPLNPRAA